MSKFNPDWTEAMLEKSKRATRTYTFNDTILYYEQKRNDE